MVEERHDGPAIRILNVFTQGRAPLNGNPLCVVENGTRARHAAMQAIARQFNLSETTFILPRDARRRVRADLHSGVRDGSSRVIRRWARPTCVAHSASAETRSRSRCPRVCSRSAPCVTAGRCGAAPATWREPDESREELAALLGLAPEDIGERPLWVKAGREQLIVPVTQESAVRHAKPRADLVSRLVADEGQAMAYLFAMTGPGRVLSRFFFPNGPALLEDPATGSATANLGGWHLAMGHHLPVSLEISQGEYCGRPSTLFLGVDEERQIFVSGEVVELGQGTLTL